MEARLYSTRDVARIVGIAEGRLVYWVKTGLIAPSVQRARRRWFRFEDVIAAKAAFELTERGVSLQAVRKNLRSLQGALPGPDDDRAARGPTDAPPAPRALSRLRVVSDGEQLVVVGDDVVFEPLSGQVVMDFVIGSLSARAAEVLALATSPGRERSAWQWFQEAIALDEQGLAPRAEDALRRALAADPSLAAAHNNLGLIAHRDGRRGEAREHYERALAIDPAQPEARYNLANLLDEGGERQVAIEQWTQVTAVDAAFADAHFNLGAALLGAVGTAADASRGRWHMLRYLELETDGDGPWAEVARSQLRVAAERGG